MQISLELKIYNKEIIINCNSKNINANIRSMRKLKATAPAGIHHQLQRCTMKAGLQLVDIGLETEQSALP